ncbi:GNAT family N-acetyltransferase [Hymenobacter sp. YC55]|uniref:GNAT family N-acetyltransferase n=1 Tax=Hymenobacter sp. YC55 TaxID=3034019 RepID=UPI0023F6A3E1|nr:GNAT family N-acetyltransferase [Hymenobacter sp. YC55]MDF7813067.1 GNAT family N-acetyltransferase [Hymenobacter sp. YC55]
MTSPLLITIARRNEATATQLAALGHQTFQETFAADNRPEDMAAYLAANFSPEKQLAELENADTVFLLARLNQELVGYAKLHFNSTLGVEPGKATDQRVEVERLYVREDWIGTGLGASLMRRAIEEARQKACRSVVLGVWEKNNRAIEFYRRFGFKVIGQHEFMVGTDQQTDLIMRKGL